MSTGRPVPAAGREAPAADLSPDRDRLVARLRGREEPWDLLVVGGGATGLGTALEAASRGYRTALIERDDFGKATSSRSTKLVHGGVRYLRQGDLGLVFEALRERSRLLRNAPHVVHDRKFVVPAYRWWEKPWYGLGLKLYDLLSGPHNLEPSRLLSAGEAVNRLPTLEQSGLRGGVLYHDGQFDDARLAVTLALSVLRHGGLPVNYLEFRDFLGGGPSGEITGVVARDREAGRTMELRARAVINATGPFADTVRRADVPSAGRVVQPSRGTHLVLDRRFLPAEAALMVPRTEDDRVLFAIPWHDRVLVGTTDVPVEEADPEPRPDDREIRYLLSHLRRYLRRPVDVADVRSAFAGIRPLVSREGSGDTADLSRQHRVMTSPSGLVTVVGGKWTTYREMGEDAVDRAAEVAGLEPRESTTRGLRLHGWTEHPSGAYPWRVYGSLAPRVRQVAREGDRQLEERLHPDLPYRAVQVVWAARKELARTVEDVLARRTASLFLDARAAAEAAPRTARLLASELGRDEEWVRRQVEEFRRLTRRYLPAG